MVTKLGPDFYSGTAGDTIRIAVESVNFVMNVEFDPALKSVPGVPDTDFKATRQFTMGSVDTTFAVSYSFPDPLPDGAEYTRTLTSAGLTDGPFEIDEPEEDDVAVVTYTVQFVKGAKP